MTSVGCPRCDETFRIPDATLPEGTQVRCPWCSELFQIRELSRHLPPMAELLDAEMQPIELGTLAPAFQLAGIGAGASAALSGVVSPQRSSTENQYGEPSFDNLQPLDDRDDNGPAMKWTEGSGWTTESADLSDLSTSVKAPVADLGSELIDDEAIDGDQRLFDSDVQELDSADLRSDLSSGESTDGNWREDKVSYEGFEEFESDEFDEDEEALANADEPTNQSGVVVTGPVAPRPLNAPSGEARVSPSLAAKPRVKKKSSPIKSIIGVVLGGLAAFPLAYGILWALGKAPNLEGLPIIGEAQQKFAAGAPRMIDEETTANRSQRNFDPGRSLALDLPTQEEPETDPEASASDAPTDNATEPAIPGADNEPNTLGDDPAAEPLGQTEPSEEPDEASVTVEDVLPAIPAVPAAMPTRAEVKPVAAPENSLAAAATKPKPADSADMNQEIELPPIPQPAEVKPPVVIKQPETASVAAVKPAVSQPAASQPVAAVTAKPDSKTNKPTASSPPAAAVKPVVAPASNELLTAIQSGQSALKNLDEAIKGGSVTNLKPLKAALYKSVTAVAVSPQAINQPETGKFLSEVASKGVLSEMILVGPDWLKSSKRSNTGLLVGGVVRELPAGWTMACQGTKGITDIKLESVPEGMLHDGDNVLLLGKIEDPVAPARVGCVFIKVQSVKSGKKP